MITKRKIETIDTKAMFKVYDSWPEIARKSFNTQIPKINLNEINHFIFAGMGGSGTIGDIFASIFSKTNVHVTVVKGYNLPKTIDSKTLVIITSVSGNTSETINILESVKKLKINSISFSSGGKVEIFCKKNNLKFIKIKKNHSPRASLVSYLFTMLKIFQDIIPLSKEEILESINEIQSIKENISSGNLTETNLSLELANKIKNTPVIHYPWGLQSVAIRFKNSLQENSKMHAMVEDIIETSHNGIVPWDYKSDFIPILIQGKNDFIKTKERWVIIKKFFNKNKINFLEINSPSGNILTKIISLIYILDYCSIYLSILLKIDPSPVEAIKFIKKNL